MVINHLYWLSVLHLVTSAVEAQSPTEEPTCRTNHDTFTTSSLTHTENTSLTSFRIKYVTVKVTRLSDQLSVTTIQSLCTWSQTWNWLPTLFWDKFKNQLVLQFSINTTLAQCCSICTLIGHHNSFQENKHISADSTEASRSQLRTQTLQEEVGGAGSQGETSL